jgi:hypothetical protein
MCIGINDARGLLFCVHGAKILWLQKNRSPLAEFIIFLCPNEQWIGSPGAQGWRKQMGPAKKADFCSVFALFNKTPKKVPSKSSAVAGIQKKRFLLFVFLRLN